MSQFYTSGFGQYAPGTSESHCFICDRYFQSNGSATGMVASHSHGGDGIGNITAVNGAVNDLFYQAITKAGIAIISTDCGGPTHWGNPTSQTRMNQTISYLESLGASTGSKLLYGSSMGTLASLYWAAHNPTKVKAIGLTIPVMDIRDIHDNDRSGLGITGLKAEIEAAFGGLSAYTSALPSINPVQFASSLAGIPIKIWYSSGGNPAIMSSDPFILPQTVLNFASAVGGNKVVLVNMGDVGHAIPTYLFEDVQNWLISHK